MAPAKAHAEANALGANYVGNATAGVEGRTDSPRLSRLRAGGSGDVNLMKRKPYRFMKRIPYPLIDAFSLQSLLFPAPCCIGCWPRFLERVGGNGCTTSVFRTCCGAAFVWMTL